MEHEYFIDANIFITAHRQLYPFDIAPGFWRQLVEKGAKKIAVIEQVEKEILKVSDPLSGWYKDQNSAFTVFKIPSQPVLDCYRRIINAVNAEERYTYSAKEEFARVADSWLCAYALAHEATVITLEKSEATSKNKIKIPNVCELFGIPCFDLLRLMRALDFKLV